MTFSHFSYVFMFMRCQIDSVEEEELLLLAVEEAAWPYASLDCILSAAVLFSGRPPSSVLTLTCGFRSII